MRRRACFHVFSVVRFFEKCLDALAQVHSAGVIHGDLSPENIFVVTSDQLREDGVLPDSFSVCLVDFESARRLDGAENQIGRSLLAKAPYMAPELVKGGTLTPQSDLYSLGIFLYEMVAGSRPYAARTVEDILCLRQGVVPPLPLTLGVPQLLEEFMQSLTTIDVGNRIKTAVDALTEIRKFLEFHSSLSKPPRILRTLESRPAEAREEGDYVEGRPVRESACYTSWLPLLRAERGLRRDLLSTSYRQPSASRCMRLEIKSDASAMFAKKAPDSGRRQEISTYLKVQLPKVGTQEQFVDFSIFAPEAVSHGFPFLLDVWAYLPVQRDEMVRRAAKGHRHVEVGSRGSIDLPWQTKLTMCLTLDSFEIENPTETFNWCGTVSNVSFMIRSSQDLPARHYPGEIKILDGGLLITRLFFEVVVIGADAGLPKQAAQEITKTVQRVHSAFASYSTKDRQQVIQRAQGIAAVGVDLFLDVVSLRAGQRWEEELLKAIASRDVFYLFWSRNAKASKYVDREWRLALQRRGIAYIHPIPLDDPQIVPPPRELSALHFNDVFLAYLHSSVKDNSVNP